MTDYKQLCAELLTGYEILLGDLRFDNRLAKRARAALAEPKQEIYYEFSVLNDEYCTEAGGTAPTLQQAVDEGRRYFAEYSQDGNYTLEVRRVEVIPIDRARAALAEPGPSVDDVLLLAAIIREVDGTNRSSASRLAEDILSHPASRWGNHPGSPDSSGNLKAGLTRSPAAGEVAELVAWLRRSTGCADESPMDLRAADLLERLSPPRLAAEPPHYPLALPHLNRSSATS